MKTSGNRRLRVRQPLLSRRRARSVSKTLKIARTHSTFSRRRFLNRTLAAGALLSVSRRLAESEPGEDAQRPIFFNLSRPQGLSIASKGYFLTIGGNTYPLRLVSQDPDVLRRARLGNAFLSAVPEDQITHYVEGFTVPAEITLVGYIGSMIDEQAGTWSMDSIFQYLPPSEIAKAYPHARKSNPEGPLPLSAKREFYGIGAAFSEQDVAEEFSLVDYSDTARTLIALHPDLLCANPGGAANIALSHINTNSGVLFLARILQNSGPAMPADSPSQANATGWATLLPLTDDDGTPFKMQDGRNQYFPDWNAAVDSQVAKSITALLPAVKNDLDLGADVTNISPSSDAVLTAEVEQELTGKVWYRHDGVAAVDHASVAYRDGKAPEWDFRQRNGETGLYVTQPEVARPGDRVEITFNNVANWFLRFLGIYVQFVDRDHRVIPVDELPKDTLPDSFRAPGLNRENALFAGIVPPVFSVAGIPIYPPGTFAFRANLPTEAATVNVFYGGAGFSGSAIGPENVRDVGLGLTLAVNYGLVMMFMAAGASTLPATIKALIPEAQFIAVQVVGVLGGILNEGLSFVAAGLNLIRGVLQAFAGKGLTKLLSLILAQIVAAKLLESIPVAGQIARAAAVITGTVQLAVSTIELALSPPVYQFDLSFTHDLSLLILPDPNRGTFPEVPAGYTLYYKVNYLFDNGSPHYRDHVDVPDPYLNSIPIKLAGIPWGGKVNVSVGFYVRGESTNPSENDWCAGQGTTGLVSNEEDTAPNIVVQDVLVPIQPQTVYIHTSKIALDAAGRHRWIKTTVPPPYVPPSSGQQPGNIGALRSITVRQSSSKLPGYVGYSWQSYSSGVSSCQTGARGQLDQAANLNTDKGNDGANAQNGYTATACGLQGGAAGLKVSYNPLIDPTANFYLDTSSLMLREVRLDPIPDFTDPLAGRAFGRLNLDSTMLLLHPSRHVVSINNANSKIEALQLPPNALDDSAAAKRYLARTYSGQGTRPGLIRSPMAAAVNAEGVILVLEDSKNNNRIQAFDLGGNPVPYFAHQPDPYFFRLPATEGSTYLDLAVEFTGYLYVLSNSGRPPLFRLDIYHPAQEDAKPICTTVGMNAARLTVDFWRNVYTLNYEVLKLPSGQVPATTEPSVSFWVPPPPSF
jgi:hypothetical protein